METILTHKTVSITEMRDPKKVIEQAGDSPVAILNRNSVVGYFVPNNIVRKREVEYASEAEVLQILQESMEENKEVLEYLRDK
jgi:antitoxin StbD